MSTAGVAVGALAATAAWTGWRARRAEQEHPPKGRFVAVDGVRLHYIERGHGAPVVLLHGNAVRAEDFMASGLITHLAAHHRVLAFDRPGFGFTTRSRNRLWTAARQAHAIASALDQLSVEPAIVLAHSWATLVALELALRSPQSVRRLVLVSGYYFPTVRLDVAVAAPPALPLIGDVMRYTVSAMFSRATLNRTIETMFAPQAVPRTFLPTLGREMLVRPSQLRANAEDAALMIPSAAALRDRYERLAIPTTIFAGADDRIVKPDRHAAKLHGVLPNSELHVLAGAGHMLHYSHPKEVLAAVSAGDLLHHGDQPPVAKLTSQAARLRPQAPRAV